MLKKKFTSLSLDHQSILPKL